MKNKIEQETEEIARLEALSIKAMTEQQRLWHETAIRDAYWRRRMASRTPDEVAQKVCAP